MRAAILLAAGGSRRFGRADKLRVSIRGRPLMACALEHALASDARRVVLVTAGARRMHGYARHDRVRSVRARNARAGLAHSLAAGLKALRPIDREVWIFLADMPLAAAPRGWRLRAGEQAARPCISGEPGHPLLVRTVAARAAAVAGDRGLGAAFPSGSIGCRRGTAGHLFDIDDRTALRHFRSHRR